MKRKLRWRRRSSWRRKLDTTHGLKKLLALQKEKEEVQAANIAAALRTSRKTYQELITFLGK